jgi:hypothetical protein
MTWRGISASPYCTACGESSGYSCSVCGPGTTLELIRPWDPSYVCRQTTCDPNTEFRKHENDVHCSKLSSAGRAWQMLLATSSGAIHAICWVWYPIEAARPISAKESNAKMQIVCGAFK